jgi:glycosyltransferase involved in cell wall biosynthesis
VLHIINDLSVGGAEMMLYKFLSGADFSSYSPTVISLGRRSKLDARIEALGVPVYHIGMRPSKLPTRRQLWQLVSAVHRIKPQLIQGWMYHGCLAAELSRAVAARQAPVVWSIHSCNNDLTLEKRLTVTFIRLCRRLSARATKIIYVSEESRRQHEAMGYCARNSRVIPNGFDMTSFAPSTEARASVRAELGVSEDHLLIGLVGRFHPMKDHINFLLAATMLSKEFPASQFLLVGREVDAGNHVLRRHVAAWGLEGRAHLLGERNDIPRLIAASDISSLSSSYGESFPLVVGEAMACGVPCVVTDVGDSAKLVGPTGLVVPPRNPAALAQAWRELIHLGSDGRAQLGQAARERIRENFMLASVIAQYEALFRSVLPQPPRV